MTARSAIAEDMAMTISGKTYPRAEHPIVRTHPVTGKKCLFVNRFFTTRIVGLRKNESDAILEMLYRHIETPEFCMRFKWQPNSVAFGTTAASNITHFGTTTPTSVTAIESRFAATSRTERSEFDGASV